MHKKSLPKYLHLSIPAPPADPLGISKISGFYGNGSWAGWFLTLAAVWYGILFEPASSSVRDVLDVLGHTLYMNWAAVDVCRQLHAFKPSDNEAENSMHGALAAALSMTYWGVFHSWVQLCVCWERRSTQDYLSARERQGYALRFTILLYGLILPSCALGALVFFLPMKILPVLYYDGMEELWHSIVVDHICAGGQFVACFVFSLLLAEWKLLEEKWIGMSHSVAVLFYFFASGNHKTLWLFLGNPLPWITGLWTVLVFIMVWGWHIVLILAGPFVASAYMVRIIISRGDIVRKSCLFMPCAPQSITDWDQAFGLLSGLAMLLFQVGPQVFKMSSRLRKKLISKDQ